MESLNFYACNLMTFEPAKGKKKKMKNFQTSRSILRFTKLQNHSVPTTDTDSQLEVKLNN